MSFLHAFITQIYIALLKGYRPDVLQTSALGRIYGWGWVPEVQ